MYLTQYYLIFVKRVISVKKLNPVTFFTDITMVWCWMLNLPPSVIFLSSRRANQFLSHPKSVFGSLTICHRNNTYIHFFTNTKNQHHSMFVISYVTFKMYISCLFQVKIASDPKTDYDSKTDFPFYIKMKYSQMVSQCISCGQKCNTSSIKKLASFVLRSFLVGPLTFHPWPSGLYDKNKLLE